MPVNPFDQFDDAGTKANPFDQFDGATSAAPKPIKAVPKSNTGIGFIDKSNDKRMADYATMRGNIEAAKTAPRMGFIDSLTSDFNEPRINAVQGIKEGWNALTHTQAPTNLNPLSPEGQAYSKATRAASDKIGRNVLAAVASPFTGALDVVTRPIARGAEMLGIADEATGRKAINGALAAIGPEVASVAAPAKVNALAPIVESFDRAGVAPSLAAAKGKGASTFANVVMENPIAGIPARARANAQIGQTAAKASEIAKGYGTVRGPQIAGEGVQEGIANYAKGRSDPGSFSNRSDQLYEKAFTPIQQGEAAKISANGASPVVAPETEATLSALATRTNGEIGKLIIDPKIGQIGAAIQADKGVTTFQDLRDLRTWVRNEQKKTPALRQGIDDASLQRMESALTSDIYSNAEALGGPKASADLRRADQYYRLGNERIKNALQPFANASSGESAYSRVIQSAGSTNSADAQKLASLKRSLSPDEFGDVAATVINQLGKPSAGGVGVTGGDGFSVSNFVTNYNKLSPAGRDILFGSKAGGGAQATRLKSELDNLVSVADRLKAVEKGANTSKSAVNLQTFGTIGALANPATAIPAVKVLGTMAGAGELLTNPRFVRWLAGSTKAANPAAKVAHLGQLKSLAKTSPAIAEFARLLDQQGNQVSPPMPVSAAVQ